MGAHKGLLVHEDKSHFANAIKWAKVFWGANSMTSRCMRRREFDTDESDIEEGTVDLPTDTASIPGNGSGNFYVQGKCPGRPVEHMQSVFDAAELGIVMDALTHSGQVDLTRVPGAVCGQLYAEGINPIDATTGIAYLNAQVASGFVLREKATAEPPLRPYAQAAGR